MKRLPVVVAMLAVTSCTSTLVDYETPTRRMHLVQPGDTLHKIAWRYGVDHRDLARWNRLDNPDLIFVGQRLSVSAPAGEAVADSAARPAPARGSAARPQTAGGGAARPAPPSGGPARQASAPAPLPEPPRLPPPVWEWPTAGRVVSLFGSNSGGIGSGIAISGEVGQPVRAAAPGRVVYAGTGLIGYGQLVIIMHNDTYLSAYGHNARLLVSQGQGVARGETIAEMGIGPERQPRLHFEIRQNGVPVDPMRFLAAAP